MYENLAALRNDNVSNTLLATSLVRYTNILYRVIETRFTLFTYIIVNVFHEINELLIIIHEL